MAGILRGDIYWCDLEPTKGHEQKGVRPVLVLSNDFFNKYSQTVIAMVLTSQPQRASYPLTYKLKNMNLPKESWVKISQIRTLSIKRLSNKIGTVDSDQLDIITQGLNEIIY